MTIADMNDFTQHFKTDIDPTVVPEHLDSILESLMEFTNRADLRFDWHEPDEVGVTAIVTGRTFDNALGNRPDSGEMVVTLLRYNGLRLDINLASLFALATAPHRKETT